MQDGLRVCVKDELLWDPVGESKKPEDVCRIQIAACRRMEGAM